MKVVTVATDSQGLFPVFQEACKRHALDLVVLGWGQSWQGFSWRWRLLEEYLQTLPAREIVVWTDAYDVLPVANASKIQQRFLAYGKDLVFSMEDANINIFRKYVRNKLFGNCQAGKHINGGLYVGYASTLLEMIGILKQNIMKNDDDDQFILNTRLCTTDFFLKKCGVDSSNLLFYNIMSKTHWDPSIDTCFIHGPANVDMSDVLKIHGYSLEKTHRDQWSYSVEFVKNAGKNLRNTWHNFLPELVLVVGIVLVYIVLRKSKIFKRA